MNLSLHDSGGKKITALPEQKTIVVSAFRFYQKFFISLFMMLSLLGFHQNLAAQLNTAIDLSTYVRIGRYDLPEPTRTPPPPNSLLAQEASGVAYNWDTHTLFIVADGGTSVVQVSKTGQLINSMTLAQGSSPQGTEFYDPEGITYVGNGKFVMTEERDRRVVQFTYVAGSTLTRAQTQTVTLGTFVPNIGLEGLCYDPITGGFIVVKEIQPLGIFQTGIDFVNGTATNGSPSTINSVNLFDPALTGLSDFADVFALSNIPGLTGLPNYGNLIVLSQESGKIVNINRSGIISSSLTIVSDPGNPLSVPNQQHEGLVMDENGILYVVSENGGGDFDHPQLWVYAPSGISNRPPTAIALQNAVTSILENTSTLTHIKVADIFVTDDGLGTNVLSITGPDASYFEIAGSELFIKAGTLLDFETKPTYSITVNADDVTAGNTPDVSTNYTLNLIDVLIESLPVANVAITEVAPWASGNSPVGADWFEVTNNSSSNLDIIGWKMDDASNSFASSVALNGITSIAPGESVIFIETATPATTIPLFISTWFGANPPAGLQVGSYTGGGVGLSTGGDGVSLFNAVGLLQAKVSFGASPAGPSYPTFDNGSGQDNITITQLSAINKNGAFAAVNDFAEIGSPGSIGKLFISEVSPWSSGNSPVGADWFEVTNLRAAPVTITGWRMDDNSFSFGSSVALNGITTIAPGESVIFIETATPATTVPLFVNTWFGGNLPAGLQIGSYTGSGVGLSTGGDAVVLFDAGGREQARVSFGTSPTGPYPTFDNKAGLNNTTISQLSVVGVNGAFAAVNDAAEIGSPGVLGTLFISEVSPWASGNSPVGADWFEVTNTKATPVTITGWKMDDNSGSAAASVALNGITTIAPGESVIFLETATPSTTIPLFLSTWFGANPPAGLQVGSYTGGGVGLSTGGDEVNLYNSFNLLQARVAFGASSSTAPFKTFDNGAALNNTPISRLSAVGVNGAFVAFSNVNEIGSPGTTVNFIPGKIEAENFDTKSGPLYPVTTSDAGGGQKIIGITNGSWMDYNVMVRTTGSYTAKFRVATTKNNSQFQIRHGNTVLATVNVPNTGAWDNWVTVPVKNVSLTAGAQTIRIISTNNEGFDFNWMEFGLTNASEKFIPGKIEAENFDTKAGPLYALPTTDAGGGSKIVGIINGSWMDYNVAVTETGSYTVRFRVGTTQNNAQFQIKLGALVLGTINIPNTGGWDTWQTVAINNVSLSAGMQTIRILSTNNETCNLNWIDWSLNVPAAKLIAGKIEAENFDTKNGGLYAVATSDAGGGQQVAGLSNGSWMDYNVTVAQTGTYTVNFRVATPQNNAQFQIKQGATVLKTVSIPNTGGWDIWQTVAATNVSLAAGVQTIRIQLSSNESCNFNWMDWVFASVPVAPVTTINVSSDIVPAQNEIKVSDISVSVFPNPAASYFNLKVQSKNMEQITIRIVDIAGRQVQQLQAMPGQAIRFGDKMRSGIYMVEVRQGSERIVTKVVKQ